MSISDRLVYRGVVGKWRHAGRKALMGAVYLLIGIGLFVFISWGVINGVRGVSAAVVIMLMWILALGDAMKEINVTISWVTDDDDPADIY